MKFSSEPPAAALFFALAFSQKCGTEDFRFFFFCFDLTVPAANADLQAPFM